MSLHLRHSSFSNPSVALPTSRLILQPFWCFTYVTAHSQTHPSLLLRHRLFTYVTWRAAHELCAHGFRLLVLPVRQSLYSIHWLLSIAYTNSCSCHAHKTFEIYSKYTTNYTTVVRKSLGLVITHNNLYINKFLQRVCL